MRARAMRARVMRAIVLSGSVSLILSLWRASSCAAEVKEEGARLDDGQRLARIKVFVTDLEQPRSTYRQMDLRVVARIVPDALAYHVAKLYLGARQEGRNHEEAIEAARAGIGDWKRLKERAALFLTIENPDFKISDDERRIFTTTEKLPGRAIVLRGRGKQAIPLAFAEKPDNLRPASVRIKKFWKVRSRESIKRIGRQPRPRPNDPPGFVPVFSKPIRVALLEEGPARCELLFPAREMKTTAVFAVTIQKFKKYEGPFQKDDLDLNAGRRWEEISPITLKVGLPPEGKAVPEPVQEVLARVQRRTPPPRR